MNFHTQHNFRKCRFLLCLRLQFFDTSVIFVDNAIYFEKFDFVEFAFAREKQIKGYSREKKIKLIESVNSEWKELDV